MTENIPPASAENQPPSVPYGAPAAAGTPAPTVPVKAKKSLFGRWWFWVIVAVVVLGVIGAMSGNKGASAPDGASNTAATDAGATADDAPDDKPAAEKPAEEPAALPGVGETVTVGDLAVTVTAIEGGKTAVGEAPFEEKAQGVFTMLSVTVQNNGSAAESVFSNNFVVLDEQKREFEPSTTAAVYLGDASFVFQEINPGNTATGTLVFDLPADVAPKVLKFSAGLFGGDAVEIALG